MCLMQCLAHNKCLVFAVVKDSGLQIDKMSETGKTFFCVFCIDCERALYLSLTVKLRFHLDIKNNLEFFLILLSYF